MPRYHLDVFNDGVLIPDKQNGQYLDREAGRAEAVGRLRNS